MGATQDPPPAATDELAVAVSHDRSHALLEVTGALDLSGVAVLDEAIDQAAWAGYQSMIVVDLGGVSFCDAAGLGLLVSWHYALHAAGGRLVLTHPAPPVRWLLAANHINQLHVRGAPGP